MAASAEYSTQAPVQAPAAAEQSLKSPPAVALAAPEHYILFFDYRAFFESSDIDQANYEGWLECLSAFGYENLDYATYFKELALRTSSEVMMSLCPFTTMLEWEPALNKRDVRLTREFADFCFTNVLPMAGVKDFVLSVTKHAKVSVILLSPFSDILTRLLLEKSNLSPLVDYVIPYKSLDQAALQALEVVDIPPPKWPDAINAVEMSKRWGARVAERLDLPTRYLAFVSSAAHAKALSHFGISAIGITYNNIDQEESGSTTARGGRKVVTLAGCDSAEAIVGSGLCKQVLTDYRGLTFDYLHRAAWWHTQAYQ